MGGWGGKVKKGAIGPRVQVLVWFLYGKVKKLTSEAFHSASDQKSCEGRALPGLTSSNKAECPCPGGGREDELPRKRVEWGFCSALQENHYLHEKEVPR